ncbi:MAG TPA: glycosyltransferase family 4 protein [Anaerolineae bacterium]|nr:glycosyltransferase family 4 protein [Anaerolineae bacterium]
MAKICILSSVHDALDNRVFYREAQSLHRAGYEVTLIAVHSRDEIKDGIQIVALPEIRRWQRPRLWRILYRHALGSQADVFHFHDPELLLVTPWLRWRTGRPTIYDVHEAYSDFIKVKDYMPTWLRFPIAWVFGWLEPLLSRLQSSLVFADDQIAIPFKDIRCPKATLFNFPSRSFVEDAALASQRIEQRRPAILYLGALERNRGSRLMIEAFDQVLKDFPEARLLLVGHLTPPDLEQEVKADATRRGIDHAIAITGRVPFERIGDYLTQAAVGWVTWQPVSKNQKNIPTKLFEYMAYGLPIVCSDLSSTRPFVHEGENGYLVAAEDPADHAQAILRLLRQPDVAAAMGRNGQELVRSRYNWDEMEQHLLTLYQELLS